MRRDIEHFLRQQQAVGGNHHHVVRRGAQLVDSSGGFGRKLAVTAQRRRLRDGQTVLGRVTLDRARLQFHAAPGGSVRLGQDERHRKAGFVDGGKRRRGKLRRTGKNDA
jgi:hypothetical protein